MSTCPICDTKMCPGSKSHTIAWAQIYLSKSEGLSSVLWPQPASQRHVSTEGPISQNEKLEHAEVRDLQHSRNRKKTGRLLLCRVLSHSCSNAITNTLPSSLDQKGEWQENDVRHWKNAYSPNTLSELRTERKRKSNPRWNPGNEWHWELDLTCTSVRLKWLRNTLNQGIELELVNVPAPCTNLHDLTLQQQQHNQSSLKQPKSFAAWTAPEAEQDHTKLRTTTDWLKGWGSTVTSPSMLSKQQLNRSISMEMVKSDSN